MRCTNSEGSISLSSDDMVLVGDEKAGQSQANVRYGSDAQGLKLLGSKMNPRRIWELEGC
jgi:hypothetical protein